MVRASIIGPSDTISRTTLATIKAFNNAFNRRDIEAALALMTDDCVFENTYPAPDGTRFRGKAAVRQAFAEFFASAPTIRFEVEEQFVAGRRGARFASAADAVDWPKTLTSTFEPARYACATESCSNVKM